jgi:hypothetical protein
VNIAREAKYSIDELQGDSWEVRRTKQVARAILKAKSSRGLTTERLAQLCSEFLGQEDSVKTSTLNGLFAGKRRSIATTELDMFARVLNVSVLDLLYPAGELVEVQPHRQLPNADALGLGVGAIFDIGDVRVYEPNRSLRLLDVMKNSFVVDGDTARAISALRTWGPEHTQTQLSIEQLKFSASNLITSVRSVRSTEDMPTIPETASWVLSLDSWALKSLSAETILAIEPLYEGKGLLIGDYRLGGS